MMTGKTTCQNNYPAGTRESGVNLLSRLMERPRVHGLEPILFGSKGPSARDVIELIGRSNTGKTALLTQWIANCILPTTWEKCYVGGLGIEVAFVDIDQHFCILQLTNVLRRRLQQLQDAIFKHSDKIETVIEQSLRRLYVFDVFETTQFHFALQTVKSHVIAHPQTSVVMVDSLNSNYWQDRLETSKPQSMESYCESLLQSVYEALSQQSILLIYTKLQPLEDDTVHQMHPAPTGGINHQIVTKLEHGVFYLLYRTQKNPEFTNRRMKISQGVIQVT